MTANCILCLRYVCAFAKNNPIPVTIIFLSSFKTIYSNDTQQ